MSICEKCKHFKKCDYAIVDLEKCINYAEEQTNEEWFCSLPTEEKADWLSSLMWWMYPFFPAEERVEHNKKQILEWLKEVHK